MRSSSSSLYQSGNAIREIAYQRERPDKDFPVWLSELGLTNAAAACNTSSTTWKKSR
jgi:hypothetical protein